MFNSRTANSRTANSRTGRSRTLLAVAGFGLAVPLAMQTAGVTHASYNAGVKSLHIAGVDDTCQPDFALPCTPGAGIGDSNVLYVGQTVFDGQPVFNAVWGNGLSPDNLWLGAEIAAECRSAHHLLGATIDGYISIGADDGLYPWSFSEGIDGVETPFDWPLSIDTGDGKTLHTTRVALNVPLTELFDDGLVAGFSSHHDVLDAGEAEMERRIDEDGVSETAARGTPYEIETTVTIGASVGCSYNGLIPAEYIKRRLTDVPLTIRYLPEVIESSDGHVPAGELPRPSELQAAAKVVDVAMAVVPDPDDPCRLHLSGTIQTNRATTVEYRFVDPFGQPSNTYSVDVDDTLTAFVSRHIDVPMLDGPDPSDDIAPATTVSDLDDYANAEGDPTVYDGTFMIETMSPNSEVAADGFSVPYCTTPKIRTTGANDGAPADVTGGPNPTHSEPTTTVPASTVPASTVPERQSSERAQSGHSDSSSVSRMKSS